MGCSSSSNGGDTDQVDGVGVDDTSAEDAAVDGTDGAGCPIPRPVTCDEAAWSAEQVDVANTAVSMPDPEVTALAAAGCQFPQEPACDDACDCRFLRLGCGGIATAVHRCYPYGFATTLDLGDDGSECSGGDGCDGVEDLPSAKYDLACVAGRCRAELKSE